MNMNTSEEAVEILGKTGYHSVFHHLAAAASQRAAAYSGDKFMVGTLMYALNGDVVGYDQGACQIGRKLGWQLPLR